MMRRHLLLLALPLALLGGGCHDEKAALQEATPDGGIPGGGGHPVTPDGSSFVVLIVVPNAVQGVVLAKQQISANLFNSNGEAVVGFPVRFAITSANPGGASLSVEEMDTDESGAAVVELSLGSEPGNLTLNVSADETAAKAVDVPVLVLPRPTGKLEVSFEVIGPARVGPIDIYVMPGTSRCPYNPIVQPFGELAKAHVLSTDQTTNFDDAKFVAGETVTIYARGMCGNADMRTIAASGCEDGVPIDPNGVTRKKISMVIKPLNVVGTFDVTGKYDFTDAIPGVAGQVLGELSDFFNGQVAQVLIDLIKQLVEQFVGGIVADAIGWVLDAVGPLVADYINSWFADMAPPWLRDFMQIGRDLLQVVNNLEILSTVRFDKTGSDFAVAGTEEWVGLALYWHYGCPDPPPADCGRYEFNMEDLLHADQPIEAIFATFNARTENFNQMRFDPYDVNLQYGRLIIFVLNELILPMVADGAHSIAEALINAIDCEGLAARICDDNGRWEKCVLGICIGFSADDVIGWCEGGANMVGDLANAILEPLSFDSVLTLQGDCDLYEDNMDLLVDRLENGHYTGTFHVDGQQQAGNFTATFRGDRRTEARQ